MATLHNELNQRIFDGMTMRDNVREALLKIVKEFLDKLNENEIPIVVIDYRLVGSNAAYNYTSKSDIDVHIIADLSNFKNDSKLLQLLYDYFKSNFNDKYDITVRGMDVELYIEDSSLGSISNGVYSIKDDKWIKKPSKVEVKDFDVENSKEYKDLVKQYQELDDKDINDFIDMLYVIRKVALAKGGEFSDGNLIFKAFRDNGYLDDLKTRQAEIKSKELSLENLAEASTVDKIKLEPEQDRRRKLSDEDKEEIRRLYATGFHSLNSLAKQFGVSKKLILITVNPESKAKNDERIKNHWRDYYDTQEHTSAMRDTRAYKKDLLDKGELKKIEEVYPNKGESKKDFIARFMSITKDEYPDQKQRYAVANSYWDRRNKKRVNEGLNEATLMHWGNLDYGRKADRRAIMAGRGTGHFGTGFYFVSKDKYDDMHYDYHPERPIYELDTDSYKLFKPKSVDDAYALHDALKTLNDYAREDNVEVLGYLDKSDEMHRDLNKLEDRIGYEDGWDNDVLEFTKKYGAPWLVDRVEYMIQAKNWYDLERFPKQLYDSYVESHDEVRDAIRTIEKITRVYKDLESIVPKAASHLDAEDSISTEVMKALGFEGVDVSHLQDENGWQSPDNFKYGSVIYDLKPGTYRRVQEPRGDYSLKYKK